MQARRDLVPKDDVRAMTNDVLGWIARQGQVRGLTVVDLNYPQHFEGLELQQVTSVTARLGGRVGGWLWVCVSVVLATHYAFKLSAQSFVSSSMIIGFSNSHLTSYMGCADGA
jgi:hypothetical protein